MKLINLSLLLICCFSLVAPFNGENVINERMTYIVYMGDLPEIPVADEHHNLLKAAIGDEELARGSKLHSYGKSFNGFVAKLLPHEANWLSEHESVVSVFLNTKLKLHTTRSWDFLGMDEKVARNHQVESNTIVGLLDSGIDVESPSFNDEGFGPPPSKWNGQCQTSANFTRCNNKVIGAQYFDVENIYSEHEHSPADYEGHGTHTSSTAAGSPVVGANLYGLANGTARGGVPSARIAMYKVCWSLEIGCPSADILAGFDAAIADGVDIISISLGADHHSFLDDPIAIGSFHALKRGVLTAASAGNQGPDLYSIVNTAPWMMTVAASSSDRKYQTTVRFGDGTLIPGRSVSTFSLAKKMYPLVNGELAKNSSADLGYYNVSACDLGSLSADKVKGKIVFCHGSGTDYGIKLLGGIGTINSDDLLSDTAFSSLIPATTISIRDGPKVDDYINSTKAATAYIEKTRVVNITDGPFIASFSSRGPQMMAPNTLKPDIAAPGLEILAAYTSLNSLTTEDLDTRIVKYNVMSGTSMSCPHAASAAVYIKTMRPDWSVAAIKSALLTTAKPMKIEPYGAELSTGAGLISPVRALNPGLIYDIDFDSYISFLCKIRYTSSQISQISGNKTKKCSSYPPAKGSDGLNYPTMSFNVNSTVISAVFYRTVTYVGQNQTVFKARVTAPKGLSVKVSPTTLSFKKQNQQQSFRVTVKGRFVGNESWYASASLEWSDSYHNVKSPILIYRPTTSTVRM